MRYRGYRGGKVLIQKIANDDLDSGSDASTPRKSPVRSPVRKQRPSWQSSPTLSAESPDWQARLTLSARKEIEIEELREANRSMSLASVPNWIDLGSGIVKSPMTLPPTPLNQDDLEVIKKLTADIPSVLKPNCPAVYSSDEDVQPKSLTYDEESPTARESILQRRKYRHMRNRCSETPVSGASKSTKSNSNYKERASVSLSSSDNFIGTVKQQLQSPSTDLECGDSFHSNHDVSQLQDISNNKTDCETDDDSLIKSIRRQLDSSPQRICSPINDNYHSGGMKSSHQRDDIDNDSLINSIRKKLETSSNDKPLSDNETYVKREKDITNIEPVINSKPKAKNVSSNDDKKKVRRKPKPKPLRKRIIITDEIAVSDASSDSSSSSSSSESSERSKAKRKQTNSIPAKKRSKSEISDEGTDPLTLLKNATENLAIPDPPLESPKQPSSPEIDTERITLLAWKKQGGSGSSYKRAQNKLVKNKLEKSKKSKDHQPPPKRSRKRLITSSDDEEDEPKKTRAKRKPAGKKSKPAPTRQRKPPAELSETTKECSKQTKSIKKQAKKAPLVRLPAKKRSLRRIPDEDAILKDVSDQPKPDEPNWACQTGVEGARGQFWAETQYSLHQYV